MGSRQLVTPCNLAFVLRDLGDGYELDDDPARIDREAVHRFLTASYWAEGRPRGLRCADARGEIEPRVNARGAAGRQSAGVE